MTIDGSLGHADGAFVELGAAALALERLHLDVAADVDLLADGDLLLGLGLAQPDGDDDAQADDHQDARPPAAARRDWRPRR